MCELLVCLNDTSDDPTDARPRRGDVVVIMEDGHHWGKKELTNFKLVKFPGIMADQFGALLGNKVPEGHAPLFRAYYLDLETKTPRRHKPVPLVLGD